MDDKTIVLIVCLIIPPFWLAALFVFARIGPWSDLARRYPFRIDATGGRRFWFMAMKAGLASYSGCFSALVTSEAITLRAYWPFRPFHPPITIPRHAVTHVKLGRSFLVTCVSFWIADRQIILYGPVAASEFWSDVGVGSQNSA